MKKMSYEEYKKQYLVLTAMLQNAIQYLVIHDKLLDEKYARTVYGVCNHYRKELKRLNKKCKKDTDKYLYLLESDRYENSHLDALEFSRCAWRNVCEMSDGAEDEVTISEFRQVYHDFCERMHKKQKNKIKCNRKGAR